MGLRKKNQSPPVRAIQVDKLVKLIRSATLADMAAESAKGDAEMLRKKKQAMADLAAAKRASTKEEIQAADRKWIRVL